jgi:hypothetical protein
LNSEDPDEDDTGANPNPSGPCDEEDEDSSESNDSNCEEMDEPDQDTTSRRVERNQNGNQKRKVSELFFY